MKTTDHNFDSLKRALRDEAVMMRERAKRLDSLATRITAEVKNGTASAGSFSFVAQEAVDIITHRSTVMPQQIARQAAICYGIAAVEWTEQQRIANMDEALAREQGRN